MTILTSQIYSFDIAISQFVQKFTPYVFGKFLWLVSSFGNTQGLFVGLFVFLSFFYFSRHRLAAIYLFWSSLLGLSLSTALKVVIDRPRPTIDMVNVLVSLKDKSMPSTHCVSFTIIFGFLYYFLATHSPQTKMNHLVRAILVVLIATVGLSRIYLGAHWFTDCVAGYTLGALILYFTIERYKRVTKRIKNKNER